MKPMFFLLSSAMFLFSGCVSATNMPSIAITTKLPWVSETLSPTMDGMSIRETQRIQTVVALQTASSTPIPTQSPTRTLSPEPTSTFSPNSRLISYSIDAGDGVDEIRTCMYGYNAPRFVLYPDGHLIIFDKTRYLETMIANDEVNTLLENIEATGFG